MLILISLKRKKLLKYYHKVQKNSLTVFLIKIIFTEKSVE